MAALRRFGQATFQNRPLFSSILKQCDVKTGTLQKSYFSNIFKQITTKHSYVLRRKWKVLACVIGTGTVGALLLSEKQKYILNAEFPGQSIAPTKQVLLSVATAMLAVVYTDHENTVLARKFGLNQTLKNYM